MSKFGVLEPRYDAKKIQTDIDLLIVPGIAYALDSKLRLGFGGGYYDRYLKKFPRKYCIFGSTSNGLSNGSVADR